MLRQKVHCACVFEFVTVVVNILQRRKRFCAIDVQLVSVSISASGEKTLRRLAPPRRMASLATRLRQA